MPVFDRYLLKNLIIATMFTAVVLASIILLTQSLRFLELVINAGASGMTFWTLTMLTLPRFFEIILPIALMAATVFVYNRMTMDSELTVMRALGAPPLRLARPALRMAFVVTFILWLVTMWISPLSLSSMQYMRQLVKAQYSSLLFRPGVFTSIRPGLTVFVRDRTPNGELQGLMMYDNRAETENPVAIIAKRGQFIVTEAGQEVVVYDGSRQEVNEETGALNRLDFTRYTIELPEDTGPVKQRWREPEERTLGELLQTETEDRRDIGKRESFMLEIHRRIVSPLLAPAFTMIALVFLLLGPVDRRGQTLRIACAIALTVLLQGLFLSAFNVSRQSVIGLIGMYAVPLLPLGIGFLLLSERSEGLRRRLFQKFKRGLR